MADTPQISFVEFCRQFGFKNPPKYMVEVADELMTESKDKLIVVGFGRGVNWVSYFENMDKTYKALCSGKKVALASLFPNRYIEGMKDVYGVDVEFIDIGNNLYDLKIV